MSVVASEVLLVAGLFSGLLLTGVVGRYAVAKLIPKTTESAPGVRAIESAVLALLGLLLAFMFSGAASRFDARKHLVVDEVNAIGTAYLRLDILEEGEREAVQLLVLRYLDSRIETYRNGPYSDATAREIQRAHALQQEIWRHTAEAARRQSRPITFLMASLNSMFDVATTRLAARRMHPPLVVPAILIGVAFLSAALVGYGMSSATTPLPHLAIFAGMIAVMIVIILDFEYPRLGMIRLDDMDEMLVDLRQSLEPSLNPPPRMR